MPGRGGWGPGIRGASRGGATVCRGVLQRAGLGRVKRPWSGAVVRGQEAPSPGPSGGEGGEGGRVQGRPGQLQQETRGCSGPGEALPSGDALLSQKVHGR